MFCFISELAYSFDLNSFIKFSRAHFAFSQTFSIYSFKKLLAYIAFYKYITFTSFYQQISCRMFQLLFKTFCFLILRKLNNLNLMIFTFIQIQGLFVFKFLLLNSKQMLINFIILEFWYQNFLKLELQVYQIQIHFICRAILVIFNQVSHKRVKQENFYKSILIRLILKPALLYFAFHLNQKQIFKMTLFLLCQ